MTELSLPMRWPSWATAGGRGPLVSWGSLVTVAGTPNSGKTKLASDLVQQALNRNKTVAWVSARRTSQPERIASSNTDNLHWVEGSSSADPDLVVKVLESNAFDVIVIDTLDVYYTTHKPEPGRILTSHPSLIIDRIVSAACRAKRLGKMVVVLNHIWESSAGEWMPGRDILLSNSSVVCRLTEGAPVRLSCKSSSILTHALGSATAKPQGRLPPPPRNIWHYCDLGMEGLG